MIAVEHVAPGQADNRRIGRTGKCRAQAGLFLDAEDAGHPNRRQLACEGRQREVGGRNPEQFARRHFQVPMSARNDEDDLGDLPLHVRRQTSHRDRDHVRTERLTNEHQGGCRDSVRR